MTVAGRVDAVAESEAGTARWWQLVIGIVCMAMIANLQYGWTLFVPHINDKYHWGKASIQVAFTIFVLLETWLVPLEGYLVDKYGPRLITLLGGLLCGVSWVMNSFAGSLAELYTAAAIGGIGAGAGYGSCVGNALKWFPDRRGLAAGLTAMGFGAGSALTIIPIANMIQSHGYEQTFLYFGLGQGIVVVVVSLFLAAPPPGYKERVMANIPPSVQSTRHQYTPREMLGTPVFYLMYVMFVLMAAGGSDGDCATRRHCQGFRRRRHPGLYSRADAPGIDVCAVDGPHPERLDVSFLRLGIGSDRAREHHVHCFCARRRGDS